MPAKFEVTKRPLGVGVLSQIGKREDMDAALGATVEPAPDPVHNGPPGNFTLSRLLAASRAVRAPKLDGVIDDGKALRLIDRLGIIGTNQCFHS